MQQRSEYVMHNNVLLHHRQSYMRHIILEMTHSIHVLRRLKRDMRQMNV